MTCPRPLMLLVRIGVCLGAWTAVAAHAHAIHTSYAEADYRPDSGKLEFALRVFTDDIETALTARTGKKISINGTPPRELDALLAAYVRATFLVKTTGGTALPLGWIGCEAKDNGEHLWLYFECALPRGAKGARIAHRVLRETFRDQLNSILVREAGTPVRQTTLSFPDATERSIIFHTVATAPQP